MPADGNDLIARQESGNLLNRLDIAGARAWLGSGAGLKCELLQISRIEILPIQWVFPRKMYIGSLYSKDVWCPMLQEKKNDYVSLKHKK